MILNDILLICWFFLAMNANSAAAISGKIPVLKEWTTPMDFGLHFRGKRLLGNNKTWRGLIFAVIVAVIIVAIQKFILKSLNTDLTLNGHSFNELPTVLFGFLIGFGALIGDAIKSFFKRQIGIKPGQAWLPFDQLDSPLGVILFTWPLILLTFWQYILAILLGFIFQFTYSYIGYLLNLKESPI